MPALTSDILAFHFMHATFTYKDMQVQVQDLVDGLFKHTRHKFCTRIYLHIKRTADTTPYIYITQDTYKIHKESSKMRSPYFSLDARSTERTMSEISSNEFQNSVTIIWKNKHQLA
jgi:hypothetical protein